MGHTKKMQKISGILVIQIIGTEFFRPKSDKKNTCLTLVVYKRCLHVLSPYSLVNKGDTVKTISVITVFNAVSPQRIYLNEIPGF